MIKSGASGQITNILLTDRDVHLLELTKYTHVHCSDDDSDLEKSPSKVDRAAAASEIMHGLGIVLLAMLSHDLLAQLYHHVCDSNHSRM